MRAMIVITKMRKMNTWRRLDCRSIGCTIDTLKVFASDHQINNRGLYLGFASLKLISQFLLQGLGGRY